MENFNMFDLHTIMWRRRRRHKKRNMCVHPMNIKRTYFEIFSHLYPDLLEDEEKFRRFFRMNIEQFYRLSQLVGEEIKNKTQTIGGRLNLKKDLQIFWVRPIKICRRQERDSRYYWSYSFS